MNNETYPQFLDRRKHLPRVTGITVAIIHFAITYILAPSTYDLGGSYFTVLFLTTPSFVLSRILDSLPFVPKTTNLFVSDTLAKFLFLGFSSLFYGIMASLLVSSHRNRQWIGIILLALLIFSGGYLILWVWLVAQILA